MTRERKGTARRMMVLAVLSVVLLALFGATGWAAGGKILQAGRDEMTASPQPTSRVVIGELFSRDG